MAENQPKKREHDARQFILASDETARDWIAHSAGAFPSAGAKHKNFATRVNSARRRLHEQMQKVAVSKEARKDMKQRLNQNQEIRRRKEEYWKAISGRSDGRAMALQGVLCDEHNDAFSPRGRPPDTKFMPSGATIIGGVNLVRRGVGKPHPPPSATRDGAKVTRHRRHKDKTISDEEDGDEAQQQDDQEEEEEEQALEQYIPHTLEAAQSSAKPRQRRTATEFITTLNEQAVHEQQKDVNLVVHEHLIRLKKSRQELDATLPLDPSVSLAALEAVIEAKQSGQQIEHGSELEALLMECHAQMCAALYYLPPHASQQLEGRNAQEGEDKEENATPRVAPPSQASIPRPFLTVQPTQTLQCVTHLCTPTPYRTLCRLLDERCKDAEEQIEVLQLQVNKFEAALHLPHRVGNTLPLDQALLEENKQLKLEVRSLKQRLRDSKRETLYYQRQANELQGSVKALFDRLHEVTVQQRTSAAAAASGDANAAASVALRRSLHDVLKESYEDLVHVLPVEYAPQFADGFFRPKAD